MSTEREDADMIEEVAADWLAEREEGMAPARAREFERWCRQDPKHAAAVARLEQACALLEKMPLIRGELQPVVEFPVSGRASHPPTKSRRRLPRWGLAAGWAAILTVAAVSWWQAAAPEAGPVQYVTSAGGYERVLLADGSTLELNASSEARVELRAHERRVTLRSGEAHFSVAQDKARPFIVEAGGVAVRAVGTAFNVRLAAAAVEVLVTEGRVAVAPAGGIGQRSEVRGRTADPTNRETRSTAHPIPTELGANERLVIPMLVAKPLLETVPLPVIEKVKPETIREALAWQERKLVFAETPLREVVAQFNRRNRIQLVVGDAALAERPVGGTFAADNVEGFVRLLEGSGTVAVERRGDAEIVLRQAR